MGTFSRSLELSNPYWTSFSFQARTKTHSRSIRWWSLVGDGVSGHLRIGRPLLDSRSHRRFHCQGQTKAFWVPLVSFISAWANILAEILFENIFDGLLVSFLKNWPTPATFSFIFGLFKQTSIQFLQQINMKKCQFHPVYGAGMRTHDLSIMSHLP